MRAKELPTLNKVYLYTKELVRLTYQNTCYGCQGLDGGHKTLERPEILPDLY